MQATVELMPINPLQTHARLFSMLVLSWALASCGTSTPRVVCPASSSSSTTCTCGSGTAACPISPGPAFLYASGGGTIAGFSIDHSTGALSQVATATGPSISYGLAAVNNQFLFASDRSQGQMDGFSINQTTGVLTTLQGSPFPAGTLSAPTGLASPSGSSFLYAADIAAVDSFTVNSAGMPSAIMGSPFPSGSSLFLAADPSGEFLYAPDANPPGSVIAFTISSTGALTAVPDSPFAIPGQTDSLPTGIVDTGSYVYVTLSLTSQIAAFSIVTGTGALTPVPNSPFPTGANPAAIVFANGFLYVLNDGSISGYSINSSSGVLTPLSGSPFAIVGLAIAADSLDQYLYVSGLTGIQAFSIDPISGSLTPVAGSPFPASLTLPQVLTVVQIPPP
jgi:6-phosphogluconolactonase